MFIGSLTRRPPDEGLLDYCEIMVPFLVYRGMGRKIRHLVEADGFLSKPTAW